MKRYIIKTKQGYLQDLLNATNFIGYTTNKQDATVFTYNKAVEHAYKLVVIYNDLNYAVMVEVV